MSAPGLTLGDAALDAEHLRLSQLGEALLVAAPADARAALQALHSHAREHFAHEDQDLREHGGANASCHLDEHAAVLESLAMVSMRLAAAPTGAAELDLVERLALEWLRWLPVHVAEMDAALAQARTRARFGAQPLRFAGVAPRTLHP